MAVFSLMESFVWLIPFLCKGRRGEKMKKKVKEKIKGSIENERDETRPRTECSKATEHGSSDSWRHRGGKVRQNVPVRNGRKTTTR